VPRNVATYKQHDLGISGGALAVDVSMDRPAFEAGIRDGDIILEVDGRTIKNQSDLLRSMYLRSPGETAQVVYLRDGEKTTASIKLDDPATLQTEQPAEPEMPQDRFRNMPPEFFREGPRSQRPDSGQRSQRPVLGINVETVGPAQRSQFNMPSSATGAVVTSVTEGGIASQLGFEVGDVITSIDGEEITKAQDVVKILSAKSWGDRLNVEGMQYNESGTVQFSRSIPLL
jgi:S1-C subfamily serine protease